MPAGKLLRLPEDWEKYPRLNHPHFRWPPALTPTESTKRSLAPQVLPPPPTRHALLAFLIALAAVLHIGTAGWSEIQNGAEGEYASAARAMWQADTWSTSEPPLFYWLTIASFKTLGPSAVAARLPVAIAMVAAVALTFLIGERLAGYWRGFVAGLIHLGSVGSFVWARMVTPAPLFAACLGATIFCLTTGYQRPRSRRFWFAAAWGCAALACLAHGLAGLLYPAALCLVLAIFLREARLRFRALLDWRAILIFPVLLGLWFAWGQAQDPTFVSRLTTSDWFAPFHPGVGASVRHTDFRVCRATCRLVVPRAAARPAGNDFRGAESFPAARFRVRPICCRSPGWRSDFLFLVLAAPRHPLDSIALGSGFALFAAGAWDRMPRSSQLAGLGLVALAGGGSGSCLRV